MSLVIDSVSKRYGNATVLDGVSLTLVPSKVHALLGANGSGKSTLVKIASGAVRPTSGTVMWKNGASRSLTSPGDAAAMGIRVIHQDAPLIDSLTVLEAVATFRGYGARSLGRIRWGKLRKEVRALLAALDVQVRTDDVCAHLAPAERAGLALATAMGDAQRENGLRDSIRALLLDEVTAPIPAGEAERHLERIQRVAAMGIAILLVTHRLDELRIADDVTILRGGQVVYREAGGERLTHPEVVDHIIGPTGALSAGELLGERAFVRGEEVALHPVARLWQNRAAVVLDERVRIVVASDGGDGGGADGIELRAVAADALRELSFVARPGEIVGFTGLPDGGLSELPAILAGTKAWRRGDVLVAGRLVARGCSPRDLIGVGLASVPADRLRDGGVSTLSIQENIVLPCLRAYWHRRKLKAEIVEGVISAFHVRPPDKHALFGRLSGGNQQKVLLGKWLALHPRVLVLDDPTHGVDPAAREVVFAAITDAARLGVCVLFFSTEPEQLVRIADRVLVIRAGMVQAELAGSELTEDAIAQWSYA